MMIENVVGYDELAYFVEDKVFKNFRHYAKKRYWSVIFDLRFIKVTDINCTILRFQCKGLIGGL